MGQKMIILFDNRFYCFGGFLEDTFNSIFQFEAGKGSLTYR